MSIARRTAAVALVVPALLVALVGCTATKTGSPGSASSVAISSPTSAAPATSGPPAETAPSGNARQHVAYSYDLFHHCGLEKVPFGGRMWRSDAAAPIPEPGADGMTTYSGSTHGVMMLVAPDKLEFTYQGSPSSPPKVIEFTPTTGAPAPCA